MISDFESLGINILTMEESDDDSYAGYAYDEYLDVMMGGGKVFFM